MAKGKVIEENIGDYKKAIQVYMQVISQKKGLLDPKISLRMAKCYMKLKERK